MWMQCNDSSKQTSLAIRIRNLQGMGCSRSVPTRQNNKRLEIGVMQITNMSTELHERQLNIGAINKYETTKERFLLLQTMRKELVVIEGKDAYTVQWHINAKNGVKRGSMTFTRCDVNDVQVAINLCKRLENTILESVA